MDDSKLADWDAMQRKHGRRRAAPRNSRLKAGGGGSTSGAMEARLAKLEVQVEHVRTELGRLATVPADIATVKAQLANSQTELAKLTNVPTDLAALKVQVDNLPTKEYMGDRFDKQIRWTGVIVTCIAAVFGIISKIIG